MVHFVSLIKMFLNNEMKQYKNVAPERLWLYWAKSVNCRKTFFICPSFYPGLQLLAWRRASCWFCCSSVSTGFSAHVTTARTVSLMGAGAEGTCPATITVTHHPSARSPRCCWGATVWWEWTHLHDWKKVLSWSKWFAHSRNLIHCSWRHFNNRKIAWYDL